VTEGQRDDAVSWQEVRAEGQINDDGLPGGDEYTDTSFAFLTIRYDNSHDTMHLSPRTPGTTSSVIHKEPQSTMYWRMGGVMGLMTCRQGRIQLCPYILTQRRTDLNTILLPSLQEIHQPNPMLMRE
jgi:hypothetical protein